MPHRIEVGMRRGAPDPVGAAVRSRLADDLGVQVAEIRVLDVYTIHAALTREELERVRVELFTDPVTQESTLDAPLAHDFDYLVEVGFRPGVTDNVGRSAAEGIQDTLGRKLGAQETVFKSTQYLLLGVDAHAAETIAGDALANKLIQQWTVRSAEDLGRDPLAAALSLPIVAPSADASVHTVDLEVSDAALLEISRQGTLALELGEMQAIQGYYRDGGEQAYRRAQGLPEQATDVEIEILAQTWSEHCKHKIFAAEVEYTDEQGETRIIDGLFKTYIKATTDIVGPRVGWLVSVFHDNAGIIRFDEKHHFALKAETHNSPSALDPYGGAMTGIVGVNRDILGAGMGCRCIFNTDVFCVASPYFSGEIPPRLFHPRRVLRGVHAGVKDGGNESGIPTVNGAIVFHERFLGKPLVFCGTGGLLPVEVAGKPSHEKQANPGDRIFMVGGRIGKDGIHGATFSSEELHEGSPATAVQIGDPITQKKTGDFLLEARDLGLFSCITDNGAGGLSSSIGEMAKDAGGAAVDLEKAPLKYAGLAPWEIFLSEAQERMTVAVPPEHEAAFAALAVRRSVEATDIGVFTDSGRLECFYKGRLVGSVTMDFLHNGVPRMRIPAKLEVRREVGEIASSPGAPGNEDLLGALKGVLSSLNVCSKESFVRMYDHEVQGHSVLKPFQGAQADGPGNAAVIRPVPGSDRGIAIACGICPKYSDLDTYHMMACAVDEAVRNLVCVGARIGSIAGLDNFCWPDPVESEKTPDGAHKMAQLVRCCEALRDTCVAYDIPLISGKDSMKNDYRIGDTRISIPPTVLVTAAAVLEDAERVVSMDMKQPGDVVYLLGETREEMGGSEYFAWKGISGGDVPKVDTGAARRLYGFLADAIASGLVASCHDCSDGGLGAALAESAFAGECGVQVDLAPLGIEHDAVALFSESQSRFVVSVPPAHVVAFEAVMAGNACRRLGEVTHGQRLVVRRGEQVLFEAALPELKQAWQKPLKW
jgi:phosphoribosylformylglycinamidine synthase II